MGMQEDGTLTEIRPSGVEETSRFRANKFPYAEAHGIGLSGGGLDASLAAMTGKTEAQIKREAGAKLQNWWLTDVEKVLVEGERLNPATKVLLPFECFHEVRLISQSAKLRLQLTDSLSFSLCVAVCACLCVSVCLCVCRSVRLPACLFAYLRSGKTSRLPARLALPSTLRSTALS